MYTNEKVFASRFRNLCIKLLTASFSPAGIDKDEALRFSALGKIDGLRYFGIIAKEEFQAFISFKIYIFLTVDCIRISKLTK